MAIGLGTAFGIKAGGDILGSLLGYGGKKEAQEKFDMSLADLEKLIGKPLFDVGQIQNAYRRAELPRAREFADDVSKRFNFDQPRARQYYTNRLLDNENQFLPGLLERSQTGTAQNDLLIRRAIAQLRGSQLG